MNRFGFLIAAAQSGSGKTTIALGVMAALSRRGLRVAPFKCGPDFIDPGYHRLACGRTSINLDGWMCPLAFVRDTFRFHSAHADIAVIEGVMGLFDGMGAAPMEGSSAQIAAETGAPVVLVVNARGMAASAAALVQGFARFDPLVRIAGVIFNNVGSNSHAELLRSVMNDCLPEIAVLGCMPRDESLAIPSRHLGLVTAEDNPLPPAYLDHLVETCEQHLDLDALAKLEVSPSPLTGEGRGGGEVADSYPISEFPHPLTHSRQERGKIAVASDAAFCFVYEDNLRLLREAGLETVFFSPLHDSRLPAGISGIYLPGGYPELHAAELAANQGMLTDIRHAVESGMPVYAECGGFIYLTEGMETTADTPQADFAAIFPVRARMLPRRKALGYRQVEILADTLIATSGDIARGHEFHYSEISAMPERIRRCYMMTRLGKQLGMEGYRYRNCLASYVHLHFGSNPDIARHLHQACRDYHESRL